MVCFKRSGCYKWVSKILQLKTFTEIYLQKIVHIVTIKITKNNKLLKDLCPTSILGETIIPLPKTNSFFELWENLWYEMWSRCVQCKSRPHSAVPQLLDRKAPAKGKKNIQLHWILFSQLHDSAGHNQSYAINPRIPNFFGYRPHPKEGKVMISVYPPPRGYHSPRFFLVPGPFREGTTVLAGGTPGPGVPPFPGQDRTGPWPGGKGRIWYSMVQCGGAQIVHGSGGQVRGIRWSMAWGVGSRGHQVVHGIGTGQTNTCENITFPRTTYTIGNWTVAR